MPGALSWGARKDIHGGYERKTRGVQVSARTGVCLIPARGVIGLACAVIIQAQVPFIFFFLSFFTFPFLFMYLLVCFIFSVALSFSRVLLV